MESGRVLTLKRYERQSALLWEETEVTDLLKASWDQDGMQMA